MTSDTQCGLGLWRPNWLQRFANIPSYMFVYGGLCVFHGILGSYFTSVLTTVEKRFLLPSSVSGILMATNDISSILFSLVITYFGSRGSRPLWMATGVFVMAFSAILIGAAELFPSANDDVPNTVSTVRHSLKCTPKVNDTQDCDGDSLIASNRYATATLFCGQFLYGLGKGGFFTLGVTYLDDSIKRNKLPLYLGLTMTLRVLGPAVGFLLGSAILKIHHQPYVKPGYGNTDPRWIGAWWFGFVVIGATEIIFGFLLLLFPKSLATSNATAPDVIIPTSEKQKASLKDFLQTVKRTLKNPIIVCQCLSGATGCFALVGFLSFLPKYMEAQFRITPSQSSIIVGMAGMGIMLVGLSGSGIGIWKFRPKAIHVTSYITFVSFYSMAAFAVQMVLSCTPIQYTNTDFIDGRPHSTSDCSVNCNCDSLKPSPVCVNENTFLSPCYAGCTNSTLVNGNMKYSDCSCSTSDGYNNVDQNFKVGIGYCASSCTAFLIYIIIFSVNKLLQSTTFVGRNVITMRAVSTEDKSVAMGCVSTIFDLIAFIPAPIVFGAAVDSTCIMWGQQCGQKTNCWLYDVDKLRIILHAICLGCVIFQTIFEIGICYFSRNISLFDEQTVTETEKPPIPLPINGIQMTSYDNSSTTQLIKEK